MIALLICGGLVAPAYSQVTKEDCSTLQASLLGISVEMKRLQGTVKVGTEQSWMGSLPVAEKEAISKVRDARLSLVSALENYILATQDAAVAMTDCAR